MIVKFSPIPSNRQQIKHNWSLVKKGELTAALDRPSNGLYRLARRSASNETPFAFIETNRSPDNNNVPAARQEKPPF